MSRWDGGRGDLGTHLQIALPLDPALIELVRNCAAKISRNSAHLRSKILLAEPKTNCPTLDRRSLEQSF